MDLRLAEAVDEFRFGATTGLDLGDILDPGGRSRLIDGGIEDGETALRATPAGRPVLNSVLAALIR